MAAATLSLVLASALLHALWNAVLKADASPRAAAVAVELVAAAAMAAAVPFFPGPAFPSPAGLGWSIAAGVLEAAYFWTLALALSHAPLGLAYAVARGGAVVVVWPVSVLFLGESITPLAATGAVLVCAGLAAAAQAGRRVAALRGIGWAVACAAAIAAYQLCYKQALLASGLPAAVSAVSLAVSVPPSLATLGRGGARAVADRLRGRPHALVWAGIACAASFLLFLLALRSSGTGAVTTLRNVSIVFAQVLGLALGERPSRIQAIGAALVFAGAAMLGWPR